MISASDSKRQVGLYIFLSNVFKCIFRDVTCVSSASWMGVCLWIKKNHYRRDRKIAACCQVKLGGYYPKNLLVIAIVARRLPQSSVVCMGGMMCLPTCLKHCTFYLCSQRHSFTTIWQVFADKSALCSCPQRLQAGFLCRTSYFCVNNFTQQLPAAT